MVVVVPRHGNQTRPSGPDATAHPSKHAGVHPFGGPPGRGYSTKVGGCALTTAATPACMRMTQISRQLAFIGEPSWPRWYDTPGRCGRTEPSGKMLETALAPLPYGIDGAPLAVQRRSRQRQGATCEYRAPTEPYPFVDAVCGYLRLGAGTREPGEHLLASRTSREQGQRKPHRFRVRDTGGRRPPGAGRPAGAAHPPSAGQGLARRFPRAWYIP